METSPEHDDELIPATEALRERRADRRAERRRRVVRAMRKLRMIQVSDELVARLALRLADNMAYCARWCCRPYKGHRVADLRELKQRLREGDSDE